MTVRDLQELLENLIDDGHGDDRILLATQPSWPLAFEIGDARPSSDLDEGADDEDEGSDREAALVERKIDEGSRRRGYSDAPGIVWLTEAGHPHDLSPYAPSAAWR